MCQTKGSNKRAPGRVVIYISVHLVFIYTLAFSNVLLVLALNLMVLISRYCKCSLAWCQVDLKSWVGVCKRVEVLQFFHVFKTILNCIIKKGCWSAWYFICLVIYLTTINDSFISIPFIDLKIFSIRWIKSVVDVPTEQVSCKNF